MHLYKTVPSKTKTRHKLFSYIISSICYRPVSTLNERRKLRVNVGKSIKSWGARMRRCGSPGRMLVRLNYEPWEAVDCFNNLRSQLASGSGWRMWKGCGTTNEKWVKCVHGGEQKSVLNNRGFGINAKKCPYELVIVTTALYGTEVCGMTLTERREVNVLSWSVVSEVWCECLEFIYTPEELE